MTLLCRYLYSLKSKMLLSVAVTLICLCACSDSGKTPSVVDAASAYEYTAAACAFGKRNSGSEGASKIAAWIEKTASVFKGVKVSRMEFEDNTPHGKIRFVNIVAEIPGDSESFVIVGTHYDTKFLKSVPEFSGANDGASGVGALLAMIKAVSESGVRPPLTLRFVFFDGEECIYSYGENDGFHGSHHAAEKWHNDGSLKKCAAMVLLDMIGDSDLKITFPKGSDAKLLNMAMESAKELGHSKHFSVYVNDILDDHTQFAEKGVPAINFIDFEFGHNNSYWHTRGDTIDKVSPESLKITSDTALHLIWRISAKK